MIYAAFMLWIFFLAVTGLGLYRLWTRLAGGAVVDWLMLPATIPSELFYSLGRIATGRPAYGGLISPQNPDEDACRHAISGKRGFMVSVLSSFLATSGIMTCLGILVDRLGISVIEKVVSGGDSIKILPVEFPVSLATFWDTARIQVDLLENLLSSLIGLDWQDWQIPVFIYGASIFAVRLVPARHDPKASIATALLMGGVFVTAAAMFEGANQLLETTVWYVLTFIWSMLLLLLFLTLLFMGIYNLARLFFPAGEKQTGTY